MTHLPLIPWNSSAQPPSGRYLIKVPYADMAGLETRLSDIDPPPWGLVPPWTPELDFTARCAVNLRDQFPQFPTFMPVMPTAAREFIRSSKSGGFKRFCLSYVEPFPHFYQEIHDLLEGMTVHVAGGYEEFGIWLEEKGLGWTWSEEEL